nr:TrkA C-terminal domain-containing protein [Methanosarcina horonobensis]
MARVNEIENLQAFWNLGIRAISPAMTTAVMLDNMIGRPHLFSMCEVGGEGDMMEVKVTNPRVIGKAIKDIQFPEKSLLVMVQRGSDSIIAHGSLVLEYEDIVTVIGEGDATKKTADILYK